MPALKFELFILHFIFYLNYIFPPIKSSLNALQVFALFSSGLGLLYETHVFFRLAILLPITTTISSFTSGNERSVLYIYFFFSRLTKTSCVKSASSLLYPLRTPLARILSARYAFASFIFLSKLSKLSETFTSIEI